MAMRKVNRGPDWGWNKSGGPFLRGGASQIQWFRNFRITRNGGGTISHSTYSTIRLVDPGRSFQWTSQEASQMRIS